METCRPPAHAWPPLYPGWEPDAQTPCECGAVGHAEYQCARLRASVGLPPLHDGPASRWDRAPAACRCKRCTRRIAAGDPIRLVTAVDWSWCQVCAAAEFRERPPAPLPVRRITDRLTPPRNLAAQCSPLVDERPESAVSQPTVTRAQLQRRVPPPVDWRLRQAEGREDR